MATEDRPSRRSFLGAAAAGLVAAELTLRESRLELPSTGDDQSCALCGAVPVHWAHALDTAQVEYREYGKGHTLPTFWTTCDDCEQLYLDGDDDVLIERMKGSGGFRPEIEQWTLSDVSEVLAKPLAVFRRTDLGAVSLRS